MRILTLLFTMTNALVGVAAGATLDPIAPKGNHRDRNTDFSWECSAKGEFRLRLFRDDGSPELTSDWKMIAPNVNGVCHFDAGRLDQMRLTAGSLKPERQYYWHVETKEGEFGPDANFAYVGLPLADLDDPTDGWEALNGGWVQTKGTLVNTGTAHPDSAWYFYRAHEQLPKNEFSVFMENTEVYSKIKLNCGQTDCFARLWLLYSIPCDKKTGVCNVKNALGRFIEIRPNYLSLNVQFNITHKLFSMPLTQEQLLNGVELRLISTKSTGEVLNRLTIDGELVWCGTDDFEAVRTNTLAYEWHAAGQDADDTLLFHASEASAYTSPKLEKHGTQDHRLECRIQDFPMR